MRFLLGIAASIVLAGIATAQPPPILRIVANADKDKGQIFFAETVVQYVPVTKTMIELENGVRVARTFTTYERVLVERVTVLDVAKSRVIAPDGKKVPAEELWKRLKKDSVFALSADSKTPAEAYLRLLNADTVVIVPPALKGPPPMQPVPPR